MSSDGGWRPMRPVATRRIVVAVVLLTAVVLVAVAVALSVRNEEAVPVRPVGALTITISAVVERPGQPGARQLEVTGMLTSAAVDSPEAYVYILARPADGSTAGAPPRLWYVSNGAIAGADGTWRTVVPIADGETRPLTMHALVGHLCPSSPQAPCSIDDTAIVRALATGTDTRTWVARSPDVRYQPA